MSTSSRPLIQPRSAVVDVYLGDYLDRLRHLERRFDAALKEEKAAGPRLEGDVPESHQLAAEHAALLEEAETKDCILHVKVQALGRRAWKDLVAEHPPRKAGDDGVTEEQAKNDAEVGVNESTFKDALVTFKEEIQLDGKTTEYRTVVEPELTAADYDAMADIDYDRIYAMAFSLNRAPATAPKASLASRLIQKSDETSS